MSVKVVLSDADEEMILGPFLSGVAVEGGHIVDVSTKRQIAVQTLGPNGIAWTAGDRRMPNKVYERAFVQAHDPNREEITR